MKTGKKGIDLIKSFEGCRLEAYICPAGKETIGWGHTEGVKLGDKITQKEADQLLLEDIAVFEKAVNQLVKVELNQDMFDALVSFTYNLGATNLAKSTLLKLLNQGKYSEASDQFTKWVYAGGVRLNGLVRRREAEQELFRSAIEEPVQPKENFLSRFFKWLFSLLSKKK